MDSIVSQKNELLGWPKSEDKYNKYYMFFSENYTKLPVPNKDGDFIDFISGSVKYINADGTIKWSYSVYESPYYILKAGLTIYKIPSAFVTDTYVFFLVEYSSSDSSHVVARISLEDGSVVYASTKVGVAEHFTQQGNDLIIGGNTGSTQYLPKIYRVNMDSLDVAVEPPNPFTIKEYLQNSDYRDFAVSLFNGNLLIARGGIDDGGSYNSHDACSVVWGLNEDLSLTIPSSKKRLHTAHGISINMFSGDVQQISPDLFYCGKFSAENRSDPAPPFRPKFVTRAALEEWASDCIYKTTGFRIPLNDEGA